MVPGSLQIKTLEHTDSARWDTFVNQCPEATFFHRAGWKEVVERAFKHPTYFLYAEIDGRIEGIVPLVHVNSRLFGNALVSSPFCVYGGVVARTDNARQTLELAACDLAQRLQVDYVEMRNRTLRNPTWPSKDLYVTFRKELDPDPERNLLNVPRKQRAMIRKGMKAGLVGEIDSDVERCYAVYSESVRNLGTPVYSLKYFKLLKEVFGDSCEALVITKDSRALAAVLSFYFRDQVLPYYGGSTTEGHRIRGCNDFLYWDLMRRASERGCRLFDYGRSKRGTGSAAFKKNWGFEPEPLHYEYHLVKEQQVPNAKNPLNPKYQMFIRLWRHMPLSLSQTVGPFLSKDLG
jgi:FemAB-related protein (PEP-CTERM system-associated)